MVQSQLSAYGGSDPIWGFVALVGSELFTGEAAVGLDPRVRLFAVEGHIYFAEREDDAAVATRLVNCGAITANQLARGAVQAGGQESLARLFQRDATIDRDAVELTIATSTETLLASIAHNPVGMPEVFPLRHHPAGLHHWLRGTPSLIAEEIVADESPVETAPVEVQAVVEVPAVVEEAAVVEDVLPAPIIPVAVLESYPAPKPFVELAVPEWPRADDEPVWAVPADTDNLPEIADLFVLAEPPAATPTAVEDAPVAMTVAELPKLMSLTSIQIQPTSAEMFQPKPIELEPPVVALASPVAPVNPLEPAIPADLIPSLPKLAAGPMSVKDLKADLKRAAEFASEPFGTPSNRMAAVQIWEMVDEVFEDPKKEDVRVGGGSPPERSRGWRHKKG